MSLWYALVDLLPFEWAQPGMMFFMKNALLAVLVITPLFGVLSTMVVHSRMSFFSDALGHSAFTGMAIGALWGFHEPTWAAVLFAMLFALLFNLVKRRSALASDTVIGVFSSTAVALGIFLSTLGGRSFTRFNNLLIGDILSVEPAKIGVLALILLAVVLLWLVSFNQLMLSAVHPALADSRGVRVFWQETVFSLAIAVVVTLSMTWVVLPAAAARNVARTMRQYHLFSLLGGGSGRRCRADDLLLSGRVRRRGGHPVSGGVVCPDLFGAEEIENSPPAGGEFLILDIHQDVVGAVLLELGDICVDAAGELGVVGLVNGGVVHVAAGQVLGQNLEKHIVFVLYNGLVDAALYKGAGGDHLPLVQLRQLGHALYGGPAEQQALYLVIVGKALVSAGRV